MRTKTQTGHKLGRSNRRKSQRTQIRPGLQNPEHEGNTGGRSRKQRNTKKKRGGENSISRPVLHPRHTHLQVQRHVSCSFPPCILIHACFMHPTGHWLGPVTGWAGPGRAQPSKNRKNKKKRKNKKVEKIKNK